MTFNHRKLALFATTMLSLGASMPAAAQEDGEIIVTARRFEERLQDVPISISVMTQQEITNRNIVSAKDLATYTPSLSTNSQFGSDNANFAIRGFVQDLFTSPSVGVYFADVIAPRGAGTLQAGDGAGPGSFFDLQNVQVLKGPQGTLFGRNTTGGAILLVPQKPTGRFEGYVEGSVGNYDMRRLQAVVNVPLSDTARLRVGVDRMTRDGYLNNISGLGARDLADVSYVTARASLVVDLTPDLENYTIVSYTRSHNNGSTTKLLECNPNAVIGSSSAGYFPAGYMCGQQLAREAATGDFYTVSNSKPDARSITDQWQIINTTTLKASDTLTIKNIVSYAELYNSLRQNPFGTYFIIPTQAELDAANVLTPGGTIVQTPAAFVGQGVGTPNIGELGRNPSNHQSTFTEELQFQGVAFDDRLTWQAGAYLELAEPLSHRVGSANTNFANCSDQGNLQCAPAYGLLASVTPEQRNTRYRDVAVYAQATYNITDSVKFTGGIRYTDDLSKSVSEAFTYRFLSNGTRVFTQCTNSDAVLPNCTKTLRQVSNAPTWLANLDWKPVEDVLLYAKYARGYRQGLVSPRGLSPNDSFDQEKVESYELGAKTKWRGAMPGHLNIAGFYNDFSDQQIVVTFVNALRTTNTAICNCATSRIYGLEVDGSISPIWGLKLNGAFSYLNTRITAFNTPSLPSSTVGGAWTLRTFPTVGSPLALTPKYKATGTAAYTLPLPETVGEVTLAATVVYSSSYLSQYSSRAGVDAFTLLNLNLNWENVAGSPVDLGLFATNVTKQEYVAYKNDLYSDLGFVSGVLGEPRTYGIRLKYRFGASAR
jgi:iron complex outermembrane receptor protein